MPEAVMSVLENLTIGIMFVVMLAGLFGMLIPTFPGGIIIWLASLAYGLLFGFEGAGLWVFIVITIFMLIGSIGDNIVMGKAARGKGGSWLAIILGLIAGVAGTIIFPPFGGIIGAPAVLFLVEYLRLRDTKMAFEITKGLMVGWGWSLLMRFGLGIGMIMLWGFWVWRNGV